MQVNSLPINIPALIERVKLVVLSPRVGWDTISQEQDSPKSITVQTIGPLACIGALATFIGLQIFGLQVPFFGTWRPGFFSSLITQVLQVAIMIAALFIDAWVLQFLAPQFKRSISYQRAFSLVAYSAIPAYLVGVMGLVPALMTLSPFAAAYSLYILFHGMQKMVDPPQSGTTSTSIGAFFAAALVSMVIVHMLMALLVIAPSPSAFSDIGSIAR